MIKSVKTLVATSVLVVLAGCAVGPDYQAQPLQTNAFNQSQSGASALTSAANWWQAFDDDRLNQLVAQALEFNPSLQMARAHVDAAWAQFDDAHNDLYPDGNLAAAYQKQDQPVPGISDIPVASQSYRAGLNLGWQLDIFGRIRRSAEAAYASAEAEKATLQGVQLDLISAVANQYAQIKGLNSRILVAENNLNSLKRTAEIIRVRREAGYASELDEMRINAQVSQVAASVPALKAQSERLQRSLQALVGTDQDLGLAEIADLPDLLQPVAIADASQRIRLRPDVQVAERQLAAATARQGVARAARYPDLSVSGFLGFISGSAADLGSSNSKAWSLAPSLQWNLLDLPSVEAGVDIADANQKAALAGLQKAWLEAVSDAQSALSDYRYAQQQRGLIEQQVSASERALHLARVQYDAGSLELLDLLDTERTVLAARDSLVQAKQRAFTALANVYRAFGGLVSEGQALTIQPPTQDSNVLG